MDDPIRFFGLDRQYASLRSEILEASDKVYSSGRVLEGDNTTKFENAIAERTDRTYAVAVNSCSMALLVTYLYYAQAETVQPRRNVSLPAFSFIATSNAPKLVGYNPYFTDVDDNGLLDINRLNLRDDNIDVISYVNLYGNILDYNKLLIASQFFNSPIPIIEDAAQSFGATYYGVPSGKLGDVSVLSFDPTKNLPNYGSGGMILTDNRDIFGYAIEFRNNGNGLLNGNVGTNIKMNEADCAHMLIKLKHFDAWQKRRAQIAAYYSEHLSNYLDCPTANPGVVHAWHKYVVKSADQTNLRNHLTSHQIETRIHYTTPLATVSEYSEHQDRCANANTLAKESISLPIYPELTDSEVEYIVSVIQKFYN